jgi:hypothetical protein
MFSNLSAVVAESVIKRYLKKFEGGKIWDIVDGSLSILVKHADNRDFCVQYLTKAEELVDDYRVMYTIERQKLNAMDNPDVVRKDKVGMYLNGLSHLSRELYELRMSKE